MNLFGLEGSGFIISLGVTLLLCGAIMFYTIKRFSYIENSVIQNAKILQTFISDIENNKPIANTTAIESAKIQSEKIYVSDVSDVSDASDASDDNTSEYESESDDENIKEINKDISEEVKFISLENTNHNDNNDNNDSISDCSENSCNENENENENDNNNEKTLDIKVEKELQPDNDFQISKKKNLNKMKVTELREMLIKNNSEFTYENSSKLKKDELIKNLQEIQEM